MTTRVPRLALALLAAAAAPARVGESVDDLRTTETLEPGSLRVLDGEAVLELPDAIVFRLSGRAGEQLSFTFRLKA